MRCEGCGRVLFHIGHSALKPGRRIEIQCKDCKTTMRLTGHEAGGLVGEVIEVGRKLRAIASAS